MDLYQFFQDFAGPTATVIAATAAALITWRFSSRQVTIAEQQAVIAREQAQIALDQLRHNLFERRYAIYGQLKDCIQRLISGDMLVNGKVSPSKMAPYMVAIKEARFFYPGRLCDELDRLQKDVEIFLRSEDESQYYEAIARLERRYQELPTLFQPELEFPRLTQPKAGPRGCPRSARSALQQPLPAEAE